MDRIRLLCVGSPKEAAIQALSREYCKRISGFLPFGVIELKEPKGTRDDAEHPQLLEQFKKNVSEKDFLVTLDIQGEKFSSPKLATWLSEQLIYTSQPLVFAIGGACGLPAILHQQSRLRLSFSDMTFPHELFRVMFLEQLYRALAIIHHRPYHK